MTLAACSPPDTPPAPAAAEAPPPASAAPAPAASSLDSARGTRPRIVFLGDSLTAGLGLPIDAAVPSLVQARLDAEGYRYEVRNAGRSGDTSAGGLSRLDWSLDGDVEVLVIELGANDGLRGLPVDAMEKNLEAIITRAKAKGIKVLLTGMEAPRNWGPEYTSGFSRVYRDLADEHDVAFMPFFLEGVALDPKLNQQDGVHPNVEGARVIERNLWGALEPLLDQEVRLQPGATSTR